MKQINEYINSNVFESITKIDNIRNYGKSWTTEYEPQKFDDMLKAFLEGVLEGLEENEKVYKDEDSASLDIAASIKLVNKLNKLIENPKYFVNTSD